MAVEQSFDWVRTASLFGSAATGALIGAIAQQKFARAQPSLHVTSCELSSSLLSRVDYLEMPETISKKFNQFKWKITIDDEQISSTANILPIGYAQENYYFLKEFLPKAETAQDLLKSEMERFKDGNEHVRKNCITKILRNPTVLRALLGKTRRASFSILKDVEFLKSMKISSEDAVLPWAIDDASGVGKGTFGSFTIHIRDARITFPFEWEDEKHRMAVVSFLLASLHEKAVPDLLSELFNDFHEDRAIANDLCIWFNENIDLNSTFVCNATITNMGKSPALFSGKGVLKISLPNGIEKSLPCFSESYTGGTEEEKSVIRTVKVLRHISKLLDIAIPVRRRIVTEKILVPGSEHHNISLRTDKAVYEVPDGASLLNLYKSKKLTAKLVLEQDNGKKTKNIESSTFVFSSSID